MIKKTLQELTTLTNSEQIIADYILNNIHDIPNLSAETLAKKTFTSKATVSRLCKKLNLASFHEFKRKIEIEINEMHRLSSILDKEPVNAKSSLKEISHIIPSIYDTSVSQTRMTLDQNICHRIINKLNHTSKISIYGAGICQSVASQAAFKFMTLGFECGAYTGINEHYIMAMKEPKKQVAIIISFTGANSEMINIAKYLKKVGIYIVGIGGKEGTLANYCNEYIEVYLADQILSMEVITAYTATMYVLDLLFVSLLVKDYDNNINASISVIEEKE